MNVVADRVAARVRRDFPGDQDVERVLAAVVPAVGGDVAVVRHQVRELRVDWRDVLMNGGLGHGDWPGVLDREFGSVG